MTFERRMGRLATVVAAIAVAAGCGGGATPPPSPSTTPSASLVEASASPSPSVEVSPSASTLPPGVAILDAPASVKAGLPFQVAWAGPGEPNDYVTMVVMGVTQRTDEQTFATSSPSPGKLIAPMKAGEYELWYVLAASDLAIARRPITVIP